MKKILIVSLAIMSLMVSDIYKDPDTGLRWQNDASVGGKELHWEDALEYCSNLRLGGFKDWRLPSIEELISLRDYYNRETGYKKGIIDHSSKYGRPNSYWSSRSSAEDPNDMYFFNAHNEGSANKKFDTYCVRCVRGE